MKILNLIIFRVQTIIDIAKDQIHLLTPDGAAWEDMEIQLDLQGIDFANVVYEADSQGVRYVNKKTSY
jgi:hypothetical protein